jgi:hypothetical protein
MSLSESAPFTGQVLWTYNFVNLSLIGDQGVEDNAEDLLSSGFAAWRLIERAKAEAEVEIRADWFEGGDKAPEAFDWKEEDAGRGQVQYRLELFEGDVVYLLHPVWVLD